MTWGPTAAAAVALLALAACSSTDSAAGGAPTNSAGTGLSGANTGEGETQGDGDGDGDQAGTDGADPPLDIGGRPLAECDPWTQDCPTGEKCSWEQVAGVAQTRCVPIEPDANLPGEPCSVFGDRESGYDDCVLGAVCTYPDERKQGVCMALCGGSPGDPLCEQEFAVCHVCPDCPSLCEPLCDPLGQDCGVGFACTPNAGSFGCQPAAQTGMGGLGDTCEYASQCEAGFACVDATKVPGCAGAGCCSPFCSASDPSCPNGLICAPWFDTDDAPLPDLGVCQAS